MFNLFGYYDFIWIPFMWNRWHVDGTAETNTVIYNTISRQRERAGNNLVVIAINSQ
jgi:hypothetical protein